MGKGHLGSWRISSLKDDLKELETPKDLWGLGSLGIGDIFRCLHIQEQGWHPRERNHLTACLDLHKDHLGPSGSAARLGLRGKLEVKIGFSPGGGLYVGGFIHEAQSHHGSRDHIGPQESSGWPGPLKSSRSKNRPPGEGSVAELANLACWPARPS